MAVATQGAKAFVATSAVSLYERVKLTASSGTAIERAGAGEAGIGTVVAIEGGGASAAAGDDVTVWVDSLGGSVKVKAAGAFSAGATLYSAASGKVDDTAAAGYKILGTACAAATADGDIVEMLLDPSVQGVLSEITDPGDAGAIPVTASGWISLVSAGAETRTMAAPTFAGQRISMGFQTDGGDVVLTVSTGVNQTGNNTATFADAGDHFVVEAIEVGANLRWRVIANDGVALSTV